MMPSGPAVTTLRSVVAHLALVVRGAGIAYTIVQVVTWHSFYTASAWRLAGPVLAVTWAAACSVMLFVWWAFIYVRAFRQSPLYALALPLGAVIVLFIIARATVRGRGVEWKGRRYQAG